MKIIKINKETASVEAQLKGNRTAVPPDYRKDTHNNYLNLSINTQRTPKTPNWKGSSLINCVYPRPLGSIPGCDALCFIAIMEKIL